MKNSVETATLDDPVFLGRAVERLSMLIEEQSEIVLRRYDVTIPVKSCSLVAVLSALGSATAAELARSLDVSHQLVLQKIPKLLKLGLIEIEQDQDDARKKRFTLTAEGLSQNEQFQRSRVLIRAAYVEMFAEVGDLFDLTSKTAAALRKRPLAERVDVIKSNQK
jgi:DNA-binding MarR family transcriptional regulator